MRPAIDAFQKDPVNLLAQFFNSVNNFHAELITQLVGEFLNSIGGRRNVRRTTGIADDNLTAIVLGRVVDKPGKGGNMRGVKTYHTKAKDLFLGLGLKWQC
ncbi:hypothetical protein ES703_56011 [subsurface metagenome]